MLFCSPNLILFVRLFPSSELLSSGLWKIKAAEGFALFPGSDHIETVVVLDRTKSSIVEQ